MADSMVAVDLDYSEDGRKFINVFRNLHQSQGNVVVHGIVVAFGAYPEKDKSFANISVMVAKPGLKAASVDSLLFQKIQAFHLPKGINAFESYGVLEMKGTDNDLVVELTHERNDPAIPEAITLKVPWAEVEALLKVH